MKNWSVKILVAVMAASMVAAPLPAVAAEPAATVSETEENADQAEQDAEKKAAEKKAVEEKAAKEAAEKKAAEEKAAKEAAEKKAAEEKAAKEAAEKKAAEEKAAKDAAEKKTAGEKTDKAALEKDKAADGKEKTDKEAADKQDAGEKADKDTAEQKTSEDKTNKETTDKDAATKTGDGEEKKAAEENASETQKETDADEETSSKEDSKNRKDDASDKSAEEKNAKKADDQSDKKADAAQKQRKSESDGKSADKASGQAANQADDKSDKKDTEEKQEEKTDGTDAVLPKLTASAVDNSTVLPDGEYTDFDWKWEGGTGKANLKLTKITVSGGKATGHFTASSTSMTHVYYLGHTGSNDENKALYDPSTDTCGTGVKPIISKGVSFPVALNKKTEIASRTIAMTDPHWVQYEYTITIDDTEKEETTDLTVDNNLSGLKVTKAVLGTMEYSGKMTLKLSVSNKTFSKVYSGTAAKAVKNASSASALSDGKVFYIPVGKSGQVFDIAFYSTKDKIWHEGKITVNGSTKVVQIKEGNKADYAKVDKAKAKVPDDLSKYLSSRVKTLKSALGEVQNGLYASQQATVDGWADKINKAVAALEKKELTIRFKAVNESTGKKISKASFVVKNASGKTVKATKNGVYSLPDGTYTITASAKNYEDTVLKKYSPTVEETVTMELTPAEVIPKGTTVFKENEKNPAKTNLFNTTGMFKVIRGVLTAKKGKRTLTVTLSAQGYHYLFKGTYEEALKNGLNKKNWIKGSKNADGKWEFVIPLEKGETKIPIISISQTHLDKVTEKKESLDKALFARQLVIDAEKMTLTAGDYDDTIEVAVVSKTGDFKVKDAGKMRVIGSPNSNNYACKPVLTMADGRFTKAFIGTAKNASRKGADVISRKNNKFRFSFVNTFGANGLEKSFEDNKPIAIAFYDSKKKKWIDYKLTINKEEGKVTIAALKADEAPPKAPKEEASDPSDPSASEEDSGTATYADDANRGTSAVDNGTTLADGSYTPSGFRFSGGTGKVIITCSKVEVRNGQAYATIKFGKPGGGAASVDSLRASGSTYSGSNVFTIPVNLNANNTIVARTTAMSQPHWVSYTIYVVLAEPGKEAEAGSDVAEASTELDEEAPAIIGLTEKADAGIETKYSDLVSIFEYDEGFYLIEVDAVKDTARDSDSWRKKQEEAKADDASVDEATADDNSAGTNDQSSGNGEKSSGDNGIDDGAAGAVASAGDAEETEAAASAGDAEESEAAAAESLNTQIADMYSNDIIKYLVVPADAEVPAGLDKEVLIIRQPADRSFVSSADAIDMLSDLQADDQISAVGLPQKEIRSDSILEAMKKDPKEEGAVVEAGTFDKWDLKTMILGKTNFVLESSEILPQDEKTIEEDLEKMVSLGLRSAQMELAMFIDRSADEDNKLAKAEWYRAYGIIYNKPEQGEKLYQQIVNAASQEEKDAAIKRLEERAAKK